VYSGKRVLVRDVSQSRHVDVTVSLMWLVQRFSPVGGALFVRLGGVGGKMCERQSYRGTSLTRNTHPLRPSYVPSHRATVWSYGGVCLMSEVPLYHGPHTCRVWTV
jgi:hypothetical protein